MSDLNILTPRRVALMQNVGAYTLHSADAQILTDSIWDMLCMRLTAYVLTDTQREESQEVELYVPASWWQHFKRDRLPRWTRRWSPVRLTTMSQTVVFGRIRGYPEASFVAPPEMFGKPVIYDTYEEKGWRRVEP